MKLNIKFLVIRVDNKVDNIYPISKMKYIHFDIPQFLLSDEDIVEFNKNVGPADVSRVRNDGYLTNIVCVEDFDNKCICKLSRVKVSIENKEVEIEDE